VILIKRSNLAKYGEQAELSKKKNLYLGLLKFTEWGFLQKRCDED
jgi:hypothetical protein